MFFETMDDVSYFDDLFSRKRMMVFLDNNHTTKYHYISAINNHRYAHLKTLCYNVEPFKFLVDKISDLVLIAIFHKQNFSVKLSPTDLIFQFFLLIKN